MTAIEIPASVLSWAQKRSGRDDEQIRGKFNKWDRWLSAEMRPTFAEVQKIADYTQVPLGSLFLSEPPVEELPIRDFRDGRASTYQPSGDLLDTIYINQNRQAWFEDYLRRTGEAETLPFVGSARKLAADDAAHHIRETLLFDVADRSDFRTASQARSHLIAEFEDAGGLVVMSSMVGNNTHRMLDTDEFRGFTLHSDIAPLVFVNSADTVRGTIFSLVHEFAHVWRGESGLSGDFDPLAAREHSVERWCDTVAAEVLVPADDLTANFNALSDLTDELERLQKRYVVSTLVILLRLRNVGLVPRKGFDAAYRHERDRLLALVSHDDKTGGGPSFYTLQRRRIGQKLSEALIRDTQAGSTAMTEALRLMSFSSTAHFDRYAEKLGVA